MDRLFGLTLGDIANGGVEGNDPSHHQCIGYSARQERDARRHPKQGDGQGGKLLQQHAQAGTWHGLWREVGTIASQAVLGCGAG